VLKNGAIVKIVVDDYDDDDDCVGGGGGGGQTSDRRTSLGIVLPPLPKHPLHERPSLLQPSAGGGEWMTADNDDVGDIVYRPTQVWTPQMTTDQLVEARAERRRLYGWMVDFEDFEMPFNRNVRNRLQQQAAVEQFEMEMKRKTAKRKK